MENQELRTLLEKLHRELEHTNTVDDKGRELLRELSGDISELLSRTDAGQSSPSMRGRLEETIAHLEVDHPILTAALARLLEALSNAGI